MPENEPRLSQKKWARIAFPLACLGLFSLNCAVSLLLVNQADGLGWAFVITAAVLILAVFWASQRVK